MHKKSAFSLVELAIVLVILGLLAGGVLSGTSLIRAAQMRSITTEYQRYTTATYTFREKYFALPGDMNNAESFWGTDPATCPNNDSTKPRTTQKTCNGDGNGKIGDTNTNELFSFWQHLANAGLIEGTYTGVTDSATNVQYTTLGRNAPASKLSNGGWTAMCCWNTIPNTNPNLFEGTYSNQFIFGGSYGGASGNYTEKELIKAEEAWNLDTKVDDGKPGTGSIRAYKRHSNCHDGSSGTPNAAGASYSVSDTTSNACALLINLE